MLIFTFMLLLCVEIVEACCQESQKEYMWLASCEIKSDGKKKKEKKKFFQRRIVYLYDQLHI